MPEEHELSHDYFNESGTSTNSDPDEKVRYGSELLTKDSLNRYLSGKPRRITIVATIDDSKNKKK